MSGYKTSSFSEVKTDSYYMGYIRWANKNGIVKNDSGNWMYYENGKAVTGTKKIGGETYTLTP